MGSSIVDQDFPYDILHRGKRDESRHNKRVNDAVRKQLRDLISQQDIITSEGNKKVKVRLKYLDQYRFVHNRDRIDRVGRDEFDDLEEGEILYQPSPSSGKTPRASDDVGEELYEAEYTIDELTEMMIQELELPDFDEKRKNEIISDVIEWEDRRQYSGNYALIDKKHTLLANIKRRAKMKLAGPVPIINDDLRFRSWNVRQERHSNAVVFLMMDRSGSMWEEKIYCVKALYFWVVRFLRLKYERVEIRFIAHDYDAQERTEKEFFTISDNGGTRVSAAYELCRSLIKHNYPQSTWNIYCFHASDGDTFGDEDECMRLVQEIIKLGANLFAYTEIDIDNWRDSESPLCEHFRDLAKAKHEVLVSVIQDRSEVLESLKIFLRHNTRNSIDA